MQQQQRKNDTKAAEQRVEAARREAAMAVAAAQQAEHARSGQSTHRRRQLERLIGTAEEEGEIDTLKGPTLKILLRDLFGQKPGTQHNLQDRVPAVRERLRERATCELTRLRAVDDDGVPAGGDDASYGGSDGLPAGGGDAAGGGATRAQEQEEEELDDDEPEIAAPAAAARATAATGRVVQARARPNVIRRRDSDDDEWQEGDA